MHVWPLPECQERTIPDCHPGGTWFGRGKPRYLIDPAELLRKAGGR